MLQAERAAHCADVRPGKARVFTCLLAHIESGDYRQACRDQLSAQQARRVSDWRLDYDLRQACKDDVPKVGCPLPPAQPCTGITCLYELWAVRSSLQIEDGLLMPGDAHACFETDFCLWRC